jgi:hypothetical protein
VRDYRVWQHRNNNVIGGSTGTTPGGPCTGACNLISGNTVGIIVSAIVSAANGTPNGTIIQGNFVGTDVTGNAALGNGAGLQNISITDGTGAVTIGGASPNQRNVISGAVGARGSWSTTSEGPRSPAPG